jgi:hypothetical protein
LAQQDGTRQITYYNFCLPPTAGLKTDMIIYGLKADMIIYGLKTDMIIYGLKTDMIIYGLRRDYLWT